MKREQGFSAIELLAASAITVVLVVASLGSRNDALGLNEKATLTADLEQNLQAGVNLMVRDFVHAGSGIPTGGIPIPAGSGALPVKRPGPPGTGYTFDASSATVAAVNAGAALGPIVNGRRTDVVNILCADNSLPLNQTRLREIRSKSLWRRFLRQVPPETNESHASTSSSSRSCPPHGRISLQIHPSAATPCGGPG